MTKNITYVVPTVQRPDEIFTKELTKHGYNIKFVTFNSGKIKGKHKKFFSLLKTLIKLKREKSIVIVRTGFEWYTSLMLFLFRNKAICRIYFPYDITYFRYKTSSWLSRICEKYNFKHCDGIIHRGPTYELLFIPFVGPRPDFQLLPFCDEDELLNKSEPKLSKLDGKIHLVFVGRVYKEGDAPYWDNLDVFQNIVDQKIHLHVYAVNYDDLKNDTHYKWMEETGYFTLHKPVYGDEYYKELSKYDYGIYLIPMCEQWSQLFTMTTIGNKVTDYLSATLPVIVHTGSAFAASIVGKYGFGIATKYLSTGLAELIGTADYKKLVRNVKKNRIKLNNVHEFKKFIEEVT
jgi:hypothetical protein